MAEAEAAVEETEEAAGAPEGDEQQQQDGGGKPSYEELTRYSRKHEREAKAERRAREALEAKLAERENADKSEHERAVEEAARKAREEALSEVEKERRETRLEAGVTRLAAKSFKDPDDAHLHVERAIRSGDIDPDDIFDSEGKVQTDALQAALDDLLERKPHLAAGDTPRFQGGSGAGQGQGRGKDLRAMTPEDHLKRQQSRT